MNWVVMVPVICGIVGLGAGSICGRWIGRMTLIDFGYELGMQEATERAEREDIRRRLAEARNDAEDPGRHRAPAG